jgi:hypothetical protein
LSPPEPVTATQPQPRVQPQAQPLSPPSSSSCTSSASIPSSQVTSGDQVRIHGLATEASQHLNGKHVTARRRCIATFITDNHPEHPAHAYQACAFIQHGQTFHKQP